MYISNLYFKNLDVPKWLLID